MNLEWPRVTVTSVLLGLLAIAGSGDAMGASDAESTDWELLGVVDTRDLGNGQKHGSMITGSNGALGPYRHLLWIAEDVGHGTFFTEIDVHAAN